MENFKSITCLIVDDLAIMRRYMKNTLQGMGFVRIIEAEDGYSALEKLENGRIDFIITDWIMNNMDGLDLARRVRMKPKIKDIPILMVTVMDEKQDVQKALDTGINDYIIKPFTTELFKTKINNLLQQFHGQLYMEL
jgi:two-component system, chemotaxis family, chemotaxis protein CheY